MEEGSIRYEKLMDILKIQTRIVKKGADLSGIMELTAAECERLASADGASVELIEGDELVYSAVSGMASSYLGTRIRKEHSLSGACLASGRPLYSPDTEVDERVNREACRRIGLHSMIVAPLLFDGNPVGVLKVMAHSVHRFSEEDLLVLEQLSELVAAAMHNARLTDESELYRRATRDSLTGMPNRTFFYDRLRQTLSRTMRHPETFSVVSLDLDGLKEINDGIGHRAGDAALREVGARAARCLRTTDTAARLGGDEFAFLIERVDDRATITRLLQRMRKTIEQPFSFEGQPIELKASIGCALFPEDGTEIEHLMERADQSMYTEKRRRKGDGRVR